MEISDAVGSSAFSSILVVRESSPSETARGDNFMEFQMLASPASASSVSASRLAERGAPSTTLAHEAAMTGEADRTCGKARGEAEKENSDGKRQHDRGSRCEKCHGSGRLAYCSV